MHARIIRKIKYIENRYLVIQESFEVGLDLTFLEEELIVWLNLLYVERNRNHLRLLFLSFKTRCNESWILDLQQLLE